MQGRFGINVSSGNIEMIDLSNASVAIEGHSGNVKCRRYAKCEYKYNLRKYKYSETVMK